MGFTIEFVLTFLLVFVVFMTAMGNREGTRISSHTHRLDRLGGPPCSRAPNWRKRKPRAEPRPGRRGRILGRPLALLDRSALPEVRWLRSCTGHCSSTDDCEGDEDTQLVNEGS